MKTVIIGEALPQHLAMQEAAQSALLACEAAMRPGAAMGAVFQAHADTLDDAGLSSSRLNACGYALGPRFSPSWMEDQMFYEGAPTIMEPGMVFFVHIMIPDTRTGLMVGIGQTFAISQSRAPEVFSALPVELFRR